MPSIVRTLFAAAALSFAPIARAQTVPIPGEPAPVELSQPGAQASTLTRGSNLQLAQGSGQAGAGPLLGFGQGSELIGLPLSFAWGLGPIEGSGSFVLGLSPFQLSTFLVSDFTLAARYAPIPKQLAFDGRLTVPHGLIDFAGVRIGIDTTFYAEPNEKLRLYSVGNLGVFVAAGSAATLTLSETAMFLLTQQLYLQGLLSLPFGVSGSGFAAPVAHMPLTVGTGGGFLMAENSGLGASLNLSLGGTGPAGSAIHSMGVSATYTKGL